MPVLESSVEEYFNRRVKETGGETRKAKWLGRRGAPDRLAGWPNGRYAFVELKEPTQGWGLQDHQAREHQRMLSWGLKVTTVSGRDGVDAFIREMTR
jgi:hypothetical protein